MASAPPPEPKPAGIVALEISVATVQLSVDDLLDRAAELTEPMSRRWTDVGLAIRQTLAGALDDHERQYAAWTRAAPYSMEDI